MLICYLNIDYYGRYKIKLFKILTDLITCLCQLHTTILKKTTYVCGLMTISMVR